MPLEEQNGDLLEQQRPTRLRESRVIPRVLIQGDIYEPPTPEVVSNRLLELAFTANGEHCLPQQRPQHALRGNRRSTPGGVERIKLRTQGREHEVGEAPDASKWMVHRHLLLHELVNVDCNEHRLL